MSIVRLRAWLIGTLALAAATVLTGVIPAVATAASCGSVSGPGGASPGFTSWATLQAALPGTCSAGDEFTVNLNGNLTAVSGDSYIIWQRAGTLVITGPDGTTGNARPVLNATAVGDSAIRTTAAYTYAAGTRGSLELRNLIVTGGTRSGVLAYFGYGANITLDNAKVSGNSVPSSGNTEAGGITNNSVGGSVVLRNGSEVSGNTTAANNFPGGVYSSDAVTITDSIVSGNTATGSSAAGGVRGDSGVTITSSTIADNTGTGTGGGVSSGGPVAVTTSTLSGNTAGGAGGGIWAGGAVTLTNATVTGNAGGAGTVGGVRSSVSLTARFSTISGNVKPASGYSDVLLSANNPLALTGSIVGGADADACSATAANRTASYSLATSAGCLPTAMGTNALTTNTGLALGTLAANGGPTSTRLPANASPAVGFAPDALGTGITTDQRGVARTGLFTVGAVQVSLPLAPTGLGAAPGLQAATLDFVAGSDAGSPITNYEYALSTDGGATYGAWTPMSPATTTSPFTIAGLTGGTTYDITLRAVNATGAGQPSAAVQVTPIAPNADADLAALSARAGGGVLALTPAFATGTTSYSAAVPNDVDSMTVTPTLANAYATVAVNGVPTASGSASAVLPLAVGVNTITVTVTASDGTTLRSYVITVTRAAAAPARQEASGGANGTPAVDPSPVVLPMGRTSVGARELVARVTTPERGVLVSRGTATGLAGAACVGRRTVNGAGTFAVACVLTPRARIALVRGPLRVRLAVRYVGAAGVRGAGARIVVVPRRTIRTPVTG